MSYPFDLQQDINDGMDPDEVFTVQCCQCGKAAVDSILTFWCEDPFFDSDTWVCKECELVLEEETQGWRWGV